MKLKPRKEPKVCNFILEGKWIILEVSPADVSACTTDGMLITQSTRAAR